MEPTRPHGQRRVQAACPEGVVLQGKQGLGSAAAMSGFCTAPTYAAERRMQAYDRRMQGAGGAVPPEGPPPESEPPLSQQIRDLRLMVEKMAAGQEVLQSSVTQVTQDLKQVASSVKQMASSGTNTQGAPHGNGYSNGAALSPRASPRTRAKAPGGAAMANASPRTVAKDLEVQMLTDHTLDDKEKMKHMLQQLFLNTESSEDRRAAYVKRVSTTTGRLDELKGMEKAQVEMIIDSLMAIVIVANAIFLWIDADANSNGQNQLCNTINYIFSFTFIAELFLKIYILGFRGQYCGNGRFANMFDTTLILIDVFQMMLTWLALSLDFPASVLRLARLLKLARMIRIFRLQVFANLLAMISGLIGGMPTLGWSIVLFMIVMYTLALVFRETLGNRMDDHPETAKFFENVPRSMFTVFRCSFGDCSTDGGVPLFEVVHLHFGSAFTLIYVLMTFAVTVGLFNVISAIFVESTMAAAMAGVQQEKGERLQDQVLWSKAITTIVRATLTHMPGVDEVPEKLSDHVDTIMELEIMGETFEELVRLPTVMAALDDLDINPDDHRFLADILDPDNGGSITVGEIVDGLARLRGDPRRSDIVAVDLMIRSLQGQIGEILSAVKPPSARSKMSAARSLSFSKEVVPKES